MLILLVRFKICRWLDRDEFNKITRVATYLGRNEGCSLFLVRANSLSDLEKALDFIDSYGGELLEKEKVYEILEREKIVEIYKEDGMYILRSKLYLNDYLQLFRERRVVWYSRTHKGFIVKPYTIIDVINRLHSEGFKIVDRTGLVMNNNKLDVSLAAELRPYQKEALDAWVSHNYRGVIALPTGSGKTIIGLGAIAELRAPTLIVVYTKEQLREWENKIRTFLRGSVSIIGEFYSESKNIKPITITTYQSAFRNIGLLYDKFSLLIIDEAHHLPAEKFRAIAERILAPFRLGLSATPYREDGLHEELFSLVGGVVYSKSLNDLMMSGFVAPFEIVPVVVPLEHKILMKYRELRKRFFTLSRGREINDLVKAAAAGDKSAKQALQIMNEIRKILINSERKIDVVKSIVEKELKNNSKIIIFTQYIAQAKILSSRIGAPVVTSKTKKNIRNIIFDLFKNNRYKVLILTTLGDEGIDIPDANVGIIVSGTSSTRQFIQRLGRLLRPARGKTARLYYVALKDTQEERAMKKVLSKAQEYLGVVV